jgi:hypothetical protein
MGVNNYRCERYYGSYTFTLTSMIYMAVCDPLSLVSTQVAVGMKSPSIIRGP